MAKKSKKVHSFADEKTAIKIALDKKGDMSFDEKKALAAQIEKYQAAYKGLCGGEEDMCCEPFSYDLMKLKEETTPFKAMVGKIKKDVAAMDAKEMKMSKSEQEGSDEEYD